MNKLSLTLISVLFAGAAYSQSPAPADAEKSNVTVGGVAEAEARTTKDLLTSRNCVRETGTIITRRIKDYCVNTTGRSYDQKDIGLTGTYDTEKALLRLDPSISIR